MTAPNALLHQPTGDHLRNTGEDGLVVIAYWPQPADGWGLAVSTDTADAVITRGHDPKEVARAFPDYHRVWGPLSGEDNLDLICRSTSLAARLPLGTTPPLWDESADAYWVATREDLTAAGRATVEALDAAYGVPAVLITFLET